MFTLFVAASGRQRPQVKKAALKWISWGPKQNGNQFGELPPGKVPKNSTFPYPALFAHAINAAEIFHNCRNAIRNQESESGIEPNADQIT